MSSKNGTSTVLRMTAYRPEPLEYETVDGRTILFKSRPEFSDMEQLAGSRFLQLQNRAQLAYNAAKTDKERARAERQFNEGVDGFLKIVLPDITEAELARTPVGEKTFIRDWWTARQPNAASNPSLQAEAEEGEG